MSTQNFNQSSAAPRPFKLLVVEPDPYIAEMLCELFDQSAYECKIISGTDNIVPLIEAYRPDLVLIEYLLPQVNGGELCLQIKGDGRISGVPVIMYSAYPQILWSVKDYGCDSFIAKPFDIDELVREVERLLVRSRERRIFSLIAGGLKQKLSYLGKLRFA